MVAPEDRARERAVAKLQALVRIPTVSHPDAADVDTECFDAFLRELARQFPLVHEHLELTRIHTHGLLFRWPGVTDARPLVLMAHLDVVPVEGEWTHPPFSGDVVDGQVWGRGTLDDKGSLAAICEAVETLLERGHVPAQDVWLSFGCDEEVFGHAAPMAVEELRRRGVRPWMVIDEGGAVASEAFPGVGAPVGVVGVAEKGVTSFALRVEGPGGHASTPSRLGPTARLARAITRLEGSPMPARIPEPTLELFRRLAAHAPAPLRPVLANASRVRPVLTRALLAAGPEPAALVRTTFAVTTLSASPAINVLAATAKAGVNVRIAIGDSVAGVLDHARRAVRDDQVHIDLLESGEPTPVSPTDDAAFALIERTITAVFPDAVPAPYVVMAATDARHFTAICERVYRFAPFRMTKAQRQSIHTVDEHLGVEAFLDGIDWYRLLIESLPAAADSTAGVSV